jgi:hypothetical protein
MVLRISTRALKGDNETYAGLDDITEMRGDQLAGH